MAQILVVDDEVGIRELLFEILSDEGHSVVLAENATRAREWRARQRPDLVLLDIWMPDSDGITLLKEWAASALLTMPVVMMSGHATIETAVEATRIGAMDFLEKPIALQKLLSTVKRGLRQQELKPTPVASLAAAGRSTVLVDLRKRLTQLAASATPVMLRGERGVMPELYARLLQQPNTPWVHAGSLLGDGNAESLSQAAGGILFIEDLVALSRNQQKNLAFLAGRAERAKVRLVSFSNESPTRLMDQYGYDPALINQLSTATLALPPLRNFAEDVPELASLMLARLVEAKTCAPRHFSTAALNQLRLCAWPGNLDQLSSVVSSLALGSLQDEIGLEDVEQVLPLFETPQAPPLAGLPLDMPLREAREAFERVYLEHHLALEQGSIARLAEKTGVERTHLYRKLRQLGIQTSRKDD